MYQLMILNKHIEFFELHKKKVLINYLQIIYLNSYLKQRFHVKN